MDHSTSTPDAIEVIGITLTSIGALIGFYRDRKRAIAANESSSMVPVWLTAAGTLALFISIIYGTVA